MLDKRIYYCLGILGIVLAIAGMLKESLVFQIAGVSLIFCFAIASPIILYDLINYKRNKKEVSE